MVFLLSLEEGLFNYLWAHVPHVLIVLILIIGAIYTTAKVMRLYSRFSIVEEKCDSLRDKYIPDLHRKFTGIDMKLNTVLLTVGKISTYILTEKGMTNNIFEARSPLELTELGFSILQECGGKAYVDFNRVDLVEELEKRNPKSGLDVQQYANAILAEKSTEDGFIHIKNYIFQNPVYPGNDRHLNLDLGTITQIMGIYLRNKYFEKYPDLQKDL